jgi:putative hemolysin
MEQTVEGRAPGAAPRVRSLPLSYARPEQTRFRRALIRAVEAVSGRATLQRLYAEWQAGPPDPEEPIFSAAIRVMRVRPEIVAGDLSALPRSGPLLVLTNHPFGILDGLLVGHLVATLRRDVKIMTHSLLCQPEEARDVLLPVDFGPGEEARRTSAETRRRAAEWLDQGHVLIVFPAGSVSTAAGPFDRHAVDGAWHPFVGRLAQRRGVRTAVMFLHGQNSRLFQIASHVNYALRLGLLIKEFKSRVDQPVRVVVGKPLDAGTLAAHAGDATSMMDFLRKATYQLSPQPMRSLAYGHECEAKYRTR